MATHESYFVGKNNVCMVDEILIDDVIQTTTETFKLYIVFIMSCLEYTDWTLG